MRKTISLLMTVLMLLAAFVACSAPSAPSTPTASATDMPKAAEAPTATEAPATETPAEPKEEPTATEAPTAEPAEQSKTESTEPVHIAVLAGPTGVGLAYLSKISDAYLIDQPYTAPDQILGKVISGEVDIAAVPINASSAIYNKTEGKIAVIAVNTLGVLYFMENGNTIGSVADLAGNTVYATGQGSTPEYILNQILAQNGLSDSVKVEYMAETTELVARLVNDEDNEVNICFIPEPQVTVASAKNPNVHASLSANDLWNEHNETSIVQGVYVVQKSFLEAHPEKVDQFLKDAAQSVEKVLTAEDGAAAVVEMGILPSEGVAKKAIPNCNIVLLNGVEMKSAVSSMLQTLFDANPKSIGGKMPADDFYYVP